MRTPPRQGRDSALHLHLDPVGGVAGDMFVAAVLDAFPQLAEPMLDALGKSGLPDDVTYRVVQQSDGVLLGHLFEVAKTSPTNSSNANHGVHRHSQGHGHGHVHEHGHSHEHCHEHEHAHEHLGSNQIHAGGPGHGHMPFSRVKDNLRTSSLDAVVRDRAIAIFHVLAVAEARVHGVNVDDVTFHEVGAWDSIADIVAAAFLISSLDTATWSCGPLPLGSGRINTAHGILSVPAPATVQLLTGFQVFDDGLPGERVTPTGAAILKHLNCTQPLGPTPRVLTRSGVGFGQRRLPGMSNVLRIMAFDDHRHPDTKSIALFSFEIDDQSGEDLAVGLERIRAFPGVLDVLQIPAFGKKGRMLAKIQVLAQPEFADQVCQCCLTETSTLGVRQQIVPRIVLDRNETAVRLNNADLRVKISQRPGGTPTAKAEMDDLAVLGIDRAAREALRRAAETQALESEPNDE